MLLSHLTQTLMPCQRRLLSVLPLQVYCDWGTLAAVASEWKLEQEPDHKAPPFTLMAVNI
jgi:hypothetical protein